MNQTNHKELLVAAQDCAPAILVYFEIIECVRDGKLPLSALDDVLEGLAICESKLWIAASEQCDS